jgi:predicted Zn-ribbon and HTH transcriptional regulator
MIFLNSYTVSMNVSKAPPVPEERRTTLRQEILTLLEWQEMTARDLAVEVGIPEGEAESHLEHIRRSLAKGKKRFHVLPSECRTCGFVFAKRKRLSRPGRCPRCRGQSISPPLYRVS